MKNVQLGQYIMDACKQDNTLNALSMHYETNNSPANYICAGTHVPHVCCRSCC